jgi:hypothetical protein
MNLDMAAVTQGTQVIWVVHQAVFLSVVDALLHRPPVVNLGSRSNITLSLTPFAQRVLRQNVPAQTQPT